jgi:hypothetical protein
VEIEGDNGITFHLPLHPPILVLFFVAESAELSRRRTKFPGEAPRSHRLAAFRMGTEARAWERAGREVSERANRFAGGAVVAIAHEG